MRYNNSSGSSLSVFLSLFSLSHRHVMVSYNVTKTNLEATKKVRTSTCHACVSIPGTQQQILQTVCPLYAPTRELLLDISRKALFHCILQGQGCYFSDSCVATIATVVTTHSLIFSPSITFSSVLEYFASGGWTYRRTDGQTVTKPHRPM